MHPSPGYTDEVIHIYAATGLTHGNRQPDGAEEEQLTVVSYSLEEALVGSTQAKSAMPRPRLRCCSGQPEKERVCDHRGAD